MRSALSALPAARPKAACPLPPKACLWVAVYATPLMSGFSGYCRHTAQRTTANMRYRCALNASRYSTDWRNRKNGLVEVSFSLGTHPGNGWAFPKSRSNSTRKSCSCCGERKAPPLRRVLSCRGAFTISDDRWRPDYSGKGPDLRSSRLSSITDLEIVRAWPAYINVIAGTRKCARR